MISATYRKRLATALAGAALASALAVSGASAHYGSQPPPPPSSIAASAGEKYTDLRMPDTRDAARAAEAQSYTDLRSPDARDAARAAAEGNGQTLKPQPVAAEPSQPSGFDLVSAAIGAIAACGLSLVLMATLSMRRATGRRAAA